VSSTKASRPVLDFFCNGMLRAAELRGGIDEATIPQHVRLDYAAYWKGARGATYFVDVVLF
jgi:hypothetical protein